MEQLKIKEIIENQRDYFNSGATLNIQSRLEKLQKLYNIIEKNENKLYSSLYKDLNKSPFEAYESENGFVLEELRFTIKHLKKWLSPKKVSSTLKHFPSKSIIYKEPYGIVLIMSPWNYPFQLTMVPLIAAVASGNCCIVKPSNYSQATSLLIEEIIKEVFPSEQVAVIQGGREANTALLQQKFDYIFFTGSPAVGHVVMESAAKYLTPITLELGGKSPCIVDNTGKINLAAKRITWGKYLNSGQTCIAPDYILVQEDVKEELIRKLKENIINMYGSNPINNKELPKIISSKHFTRLLKLLNGEKIIFGGESSVEKQKISPTIVEATWESLIMKEEIFGPILPIITFKDYNTLLPTLKKKEKSLALYLFTTSKKNEKLVMDNISFGGGCVNDTIIHIFNSNMPFGGIGNSGMGHYHGKYSIDTFSHEKSVMKKSNFIDIQIRYPPYKNHLKLLKKIIK